MNFKWTSQMSEYNSTNVKSLPLFTITTYSSNWDYCMVPGACEASSPGANPILSTPLGVITVSKVEQPQHVLGQ